MDILLSVAIVIAVVALAFWLYDRHSADAYWRAYDKAQLEDLEYARTHPGCTYEEAHRQRDKVMRRFHRY